MAVVHSGAKFYRLIEDGDEYEEQQYLTEKSFGREVTVCTVDQLLTMGFNLGHWQMKTLYATGAAVIIDEIHLYEPYTLGLIISTMEYLSQHCDTRFYVMTATLPDKLKELLVTTLGDSTAIIADAEKQQDARNSWEYHDLLLEQPELGDRIERDIRAGKKVLVVRNTVDDCVATYNRLRNNATNPDRSMCLHSRFTSLDRIAKEKRVVELGNESFLLVSTQVVEVSLDIDFDVLYTENAPIDALIQRAGRVNRKGKKDGTKVIVFRASENSRRMYGKEIDDILDRTAGQLRARQGERIVENNMVAMVNKVYSDYDVTTTEPYAKGRAAYADLQNNLSYIFDNDQLNEDAATREGIDSVSVIPHCFKNALEGKKLAKKVQYQVSIRRDQLTRLPPLQSDDDYDFIKYVDTPYSGEIGLYIPTWDEFNKDRGTTQTTCA